MASFPLVSATGMLGSGFRAESLDKAMKMYARIRTFDQVSAMLRE